MIQIFFGRNWQPHRPEVVQSVLSPSILQRSAFGVPGSAFDMAIYRFTDLQINKFTS